MITKAIFIGFYFFGTSFGWQMENKTFDTFEECSAFMGELAAEFRFHKKNKGSNYRVLDWDMSCKVLRVDEEN